MDDDVELAETDSDCKILMRIRIFNNKITFIFLSIVLIKFF